MVESTCCHCGTSCTNNAIRIEEKFFCCNGCKTVFELFSENDLTCYYDLEQNPGAIPKEIQRKYDFLDNEKIVQKLIEFEETNTQVVSLYIPDIHCSSCIWVLENLPKFQKYIVTSQVNFPKKTIRITYNSEQGSLKELVLLLSSIGYEPYISLEDYDAGKKKIDRTLLYQLAIAGFAFGNVIFLSFPEYFEVDDFWLEQYKYVLRWLMFAFFLPVVFYAAKGYYASAFKGIRSKMLNIDVPIALAASFTLGNLLRTLGKNNFYLKNTAVIEKMATVDTVIFDRTGTLTSTKNSTIDYVGRSFAETERILMQNVVRVSNHPLSRMLFQSFKDFKSIELDDYQEYLGKGILAKSNATTIKIGSLSFVDQENSNTAIETAIHISINGDYVGKYVFKNSYRMHMKQLLEELEQNYRLFVLSGDNEGKKTYLQKELPPQVRIAFNQKPEDKLLYIKMLQEQGKKVI